MNGPQTTPADCKINTRLTFNRFAQIFIRRVRTEVEKTNMYFPVFGVGRLVYIGRVTRERANFVRSHTHNKTSTRRLFVID